MIGSNRPSLSAFFSDVERVIEQLASERTELRTIRVSLGVPPIAIEKLQENDCRAEHWQHTLEDDVVDRAPAEL